MFALVVKVIFIVFRPVIPLKPSQATKNTQHVLTKRA